jgi:crotonobetainyl-CoA:carnitine CoA-transferase CaiB-like acyl-CoA transferase
MTKPSQAAKPLAGIRVADFSKVLAGPLCAQYMADMGAEVIKVEAVGTGDDTRGWPPFREKGVGAVFISANRGKRSIAVDLKTEKGREVAHRLAATCDVAIESFGTGVAERLGIDRETLTSVNPRLIHCSISGFGRSGPMKDAPGYDVILQAFSGIMALTGEPGGGYVRSPISPIDQMTGIHALSGILAALFDRDRTGRASHIEVSLFETATAVLGYNLQSFWEKGYQPVRCGSSHESLCPYQAFDAADGPVMIGVANDALWQKFCAIAGLDAIKDDPKFRTNAARVANREETLAHVKEALALKPVAFWDEELAKVRVPCAPINDLRTLVEHPHTKSSDIILDFTEAGEKGLKAVAHPVRFAGQARRVGLPPPRLGQHTAELMAELGWAEDEIADLRQSGIVFGA